MPSVYEKALGVPIDLQKIAPPNVMIRDHNFLLIFFAFITPIIFVFLGDLKGPLIGVPKVLATALGFINFHFNMLIRHDIIIIIRHYEHLSLISLGVCNLISIVGGIVVMYHLYKDEIISDTLYDYIYILPYILMVFAFMPYILISPIQIILLYSQAS